MLHDRLCLHIDLSTLNALQAAKTVRAWIVRHRIEILNIAGPRISEDTEIYDISAKILRTDFYQDSA
jgi:hypothetical protein